MTVLSIRDNVEHILAQIAAACARRNRSEDDVQLVAVSKKHPINVIEAAYEAGLRHFGENRVEEASDKVPALRETAPDIVWHMVGHIQSRKSRDIPPLFDVVHSVDSFKLARRLSVAAEGKTAPLDVMLEINISGERAKYGFDANDWSTNIAVRDKLWQNIGQILELPHLNVRGLMTMAPFVDDMEATRPVFAGLAALRDQLQQDFSAPLPDLSMGMTNDFPVAVEEGATIVRIGRAIFSPHETT